MYLVQRCQCRVAIAYHSMALKLIVTIKGVAFNLVKYIY